MIVERPPGRTAFPKTAPREKRGSFERTRTPASLCHSRVLQLTDCRNSFGRLQEKPGIPHQDRPGAGAQCLGNQPAGHALPPVHPGSSARLVRRQPRALHRAVPRVREECRVTAEPLPVSQRDYLMALRESDDLDPTDIAILRTLADYASYQDGTRAHPGFARLARGAKVSESPAKRRVKIAREKGWLTRTSKSHGHAHHAAEYSLTVPP